MFRRFLTDTSGNYAMLTALMMGPLIGAVALGVDLAELSRQKAEVLHVLDATNLATAKYMMGGVTVDKSKSAEEQAAERDAKIKAYALNFFNSTLPSVKPENVSLQTILPNISDAGLRSVATLHYDPYLRPAALLVNGLDGRKQVEVQEEARVSLEETVEVALVIDNSYSMTYLATGATKPRMTLLKEAATNLVNRLAERGAMMKQVEKPVQVALVPFAGSVNVGPDNAVKDWMDKEGKSPIHHENFSWPALITLSASPLKTIVTVPLGRPTKVGIGWPAAEQNQVITRFTMYKDLQIYKTSRASDGTNAFTTWQGCVESRPYPMNVNDTPASSGTPASYFVPMFAPDDYGQRHRNNKDDSAAPNSWWDPDSSDTSNAQRGMKKYFTIQASTTPVLALNLPTATNPNPAYRGPNAGCTTVPITPLVDVSKSDGQQQILKAIDDMKPLGSTNVPEGMAWGWRTLSSAEPFTGGRAEAAPKNKKVVIVLTDGANTYYQADSLSYADYRGNSKDHVDYAPNQSIYGAYGFTNKAYEGGTTRIFKGTGVTVKYENPSYSSAMNAHFAALCTNAKAGKVTVMTIALDLHATNDKAQIDALRACSSNSEKRSDANGVPEKLFWNSKSSTLEKHFNEIADELSNLRVTG